ncbi:VCBS repeat-containing protein [Muricauda sp. CAU 1633]|uniref:VCBS repeat-containing protein n=1 Tax=Allomuricauda sp. CAU 1633 TaxID=2816036 RepID=UPI001A8CC051|nr:VCBS repeat-containing protein [Muricauda sp. CAU 1633]MBO0320705.1 VCBS repeat-containing protein [Muricauda sp. CAU 1633]
MKNIFGAFSLILCFVFLFSCSRETKIRNKKATGDTLFTLLNNEQTNIHFKNTIRETADFNVLNYYYTYNGGGVAVGDVNNDGLDDLYFTSNQESNKLYLNKGDFTFEDVTTQAQVTDAEGWTTGTTMIDINNDGWMDIYVCKSASLNNDLYRRNKLFVNQKDGTFKEEAKKWGLDDDGFSTQAYFFDYDKDGDLDMYLINHRVDFLNSINLEVILNDQNFFPQTSDHLYRNDGDKFTDVTINSGIMNKEFSLSAAIGDYNNDGWLDVFVANDFITPDKLYINNKNGTFSNQIDQRLKHISYSSMGSDIADINNDLLPDLMVLDMSAEDHSRGKQNMPSMNTSGFWYIVRSGYHFPYMSNMLNLNNGNGYFSDIGQLAGVSKTDWSWGPLLADFDCDGLKDIFITNGIKREIANQDFGDFLDTQIDSVKNMSIQQILDRMPSEKLQNYAFKNDGNLAFTKATTSWGFHQNMNSNGAAYADLDNDGDLDLVMNNLDDEASIYQNNASNNFLTVKLLGNERNKNAIGAKVKVFTDNSTQYQELFLSRGYQSSVSPTLNFGIGDETTVKKIEVVWGDGTVSVDENIGANQVLTFHQKNSESTATESSHTFSHNFKRVNPQELGIPYRHEENDFNDFSKQVLLPQKQSEKGPAFAVADINNDGLDDLFLGGAMNQPAEVYIQNSKGAFEKLNQSIFENDKAYEDVGAHFFDADNDQDVDLYVTSGGYELDERAPLLQDRLYLNDGNGNFAKSNKLPRLISNTKAVTSFDFDADGDLDLFVGGSAIPGKYPLPSTSFVLENTGSQFIEVTQTVAPDFKNIGIVNDLLASDYDQDGDTDLLVVGEWMPITVFENTNGIFTKIEPTAFEHTSGWWNTIAEIDFDRDGDLDYFVGNLGGNNKFHPSIEKPLHIYGTNLGDDNKYDMFLSKDYHGDLVPVRGKECSTQQNPFVSEKIKSYQEFANSTLADIYGSEVLENSYHKQVNEFESVYLENEGNGNFTIRHLPKYAQLGPTLSFGFVDVNGDGNMDVIGAGAIHETEVETVRYDANVGYVLLGDSKGGFKPYKDVNFYNDLNAKSMKLVNIKNEPYIIITNNNRPLTVFKLN